MVIMQECSEDLLQSGEKTQGRGNWCAWCASPPSSISIGLSALGMNGPNRENKSLIICRNSQLYSTICHIKVYCGL